MARQKETAPVRPVKGWMIGRGVVVYAESFRRLRRDAIEWAELRGIEPQGGQE